MDDNFLSQFTKKENKDEINSKSKTESKGEPKVKDQSEEK